MQTMQTAFMIVATIACVTFGCIAIVLHGDLLYAKKEAGKFQRWYREICDQLDKERSEHQVIVDETEQRYKGVCKMLELHEERRLEHEKERSRLAGAEAASVELARQIKARVQPMILIMRPMLDALERMDLPDFEDPEEQHT